jgi:ABC-type Fe3+ transport system permease subunit
VFAAHLQKGDVSTVLLSVIDYACIVMFFVLLAGLLLAVIRQNPPTTEEKAQADQPSSLANKVAYGVLAALFVLLLAVAWLSERENSRAHSSG